MRSFDDEGEDAPRQDGVQGGNRPRDRGHARQGDRTQPTPGGPIGATARPTAATTTAAPAAATPAAATPASAPAVQPCTGVYPAGRVPSADAGFESLPSLAHEAPAGSFTREMGHFLSLFSSRFGVPARRDDGHVTLELPQGLLGPRASSGAIRLPLGEEELLAANLRPEGLPVNPARLLALSLGKGGHTRLRASPRVDACAAARVLGKPVHLVHRPIVTLHILLTLRYFRKEERMFTHVFDAQSRQAAPSLSPLLSPSLWLGDGVEPACEFDRFASALPELYGQAKRAVGEIRRRRLAEIREQLDREAQESIKILDEYYEEKARELEDERKGVYFHLYYFEKEEEIEQQLAGIQTEREERARSLRGHWDLTACERLIAVGHFEVPFWRSEARQADLDALTGRITVDSGPGAR